MNKNITIGDIRRAALASKKVAAARSALPVRSDLTGNDFKRGSTRYKIMGPCTEVGNTHLWVCRPTSAHDSSQDLHLDKSEIETILGIKRANQNMHENEFTG